MKEICQHYSLGLHFKITHCSAIYIVDSEKQEFICHWQLIVWKTVALFIKNLKKNSIKSTNSVQWSVGPVLFGPPKLMFDSHGLLNKLQANYNLMFLHLKCSAQKEKIKPSRLDEGHEGKTL